MSSELQEGSMDSNFYLFLPISMCCTFLMALFLDLTLEGDDHLCDRPLPGVSCLGDFYGLCSFGGG